MDFIELTMEMEGENSRAMINMENVFHVVLNKNNKTLEFYGFNTDDAPVVFNYSKYEDAEKDYLKILRDKNIPSISQMREKLKSSNGTYQPEKIKRPDWFE
jgi:hypothetical protein